MENNIQKFDANQAMENVREKIKDTFVSLIPDQQWKEMVEKEVNSYFKETEERYDTRNYSSRFTKDVHSCLKEEVEKRTKEYLQTEFSNTWWDNGVPKCNEKVKEIIINNSGEILAQMIGGYMQANLQPRY